MKLDDILKAIDPKFKDEVRIICNNWRKKVQEGLKEMMKFGMLKDSKIRFEINEAYPVELLNLKFNDLEYFKYILYQNRNLLESISINLKNLPELLKYLPENNFNTNQELQNINRTHNFVVNLIKQIPSDDELQKKMINFNIDIFGIYRILNKRNYQVLFDESRFIEDYDVSVELFWAVIALFVERYKLNLEAVTVTILSHEYAHAYSHIGIDANKNHWVTPNFIHTDIRIKEGIAEYFSKKFMYENNDALNKFRETYDFILQISPEIYKDFKKWKEPSLEAVRYAMMDIRNSKDISDYKDFQDLIEIGKEKYPIK